MLGVSTTELLRCERIPEEALLDSAQVETLVKTAISYSEESPAAHRGAGRKWVLPYLLSLILGGLGVGACWFLGQVSEAVVTAYVLGSVFGGYFCFGAKNRLPDYYDQNKIGGVHDGPFRMNIPGVSFSNANWPHMLRVGRIWAWCAAALYPLASALMVLAAADWWIPAERYVVLVCLLGGLFCPMYYVGKKYA